MITSFIVVVTKIQIQLYGNNAERSNELAIDISHQNQHGTKAETPTIAQGKEHRVFDDDDSNDSVVTGRLFGLNIIGSSLSSSAAAVK